MQQDVTADSAQYIKTVAPNTSMFELPQHRSANSNEQSAITIAIAENRSKSLLDYNSQRNLKIGEQTLKFPKVQDKGKRFRMNQIQLQAHNTS